MFGWVGSGGYLEVMLVVGERESSALLSSRIYKDATVCKPRARPYISVKRDTFSVVESRV